ncbi:MAG: hypothetical protein P4L53_02720 [Candidatus Obscuribacterales bacterium]|nr:hypothetical protein [Candidatus Obscuribacterales bacterium]
MLVPTAIALWLSICAYLTVQLIEFGTRPGQKAQTISQFPADSKLKLVRGKFTIVAFLHPQCPCSKASVGELEELMQHSSDDATAYALFLKPTGCSEKFAKSDLFEQTSKINGVHALVDEDGREAGIFGSKTSGQMMIYNPEGRLVFSGGITSSRGHFGDNLGLDTALQSIGKKRNTFECTDVYGCPLFASNTSDTATHRR